MSSEIARHKNRGRYFYFGMAVLFTTAAVVGFAPNSLAIINGTKPNPPLIIHAHAASMTLWLLLLVSQTALISTGRTSLHRRLGSTAFVLALVVAGLVFAIALPTFLDAEAPLAAKLIQAKRLIFYAGCVGFALYVRKTDSETHKRLMFVATFAVLDAAFFRMGFLPDLGMGNSVSIGHFYMTLLLVPLLLHDLRRRGSIHSAYWVTLPPMLASHAVAAHSW